MKRTIFTILIVSVLSVSIIVPISVAAATGNLDIFVSEDGTTDRVELKKTYMIGSFLGKNIQVTYDVSRSVSDGFADIYKDENGNDYIYKNGKITGFYSNEITSPASNCTPIGENAAKEIALDILSKFTDNANEYVIRNFEEKEVYGQYFITVARKIGSVFTDEYSVVSIMYDGAVKSVAVYNDGEFENVPASIVNGITEKSLKDYALHEMEIIYPDKGNEFEVRNYCLERDANGYYIAIYGNIDNVLECVRYDLES